MVTPRTVSAAALLVVEAGIAALGVLVHLGLTAEYGDVTDSAVEGWTWGFTAGVGGLTLVLVGIPGATAMVLAPRRWMRLTAVGIPVLMVLAMLLVTPVALREKLEVQYDAAPRCVSQEDMGPGPGAEAERQSQQAFDSIDHVGHFGGGGASGVGGCDRAFVLTEDVDVLGHYRTALPVAGWQVVEDRGNHLRAEKEGMAFEVTVCHGAGVVWAGDVRDDGRAACDRDAETVTGAP